MACRGCRKKQKEFKKMIKIGKAKNVLSEQQKEHFRKVCPHGVPHGFMCRTCNKIISIPEDAVLKPEVVEVLKA